ncbi:hypothetical protein OG203_05730 [Nocardia sp. NBC_01499]|uniref:hypothetical protein n=1 Tax=Nocardia sp. NBC_01499 TaxID=2903597 RepID=UPI003867B34B
MFDTASALRAKAPAYLAAAMTDIQFMMLTGRERTIEDYQRLFEAAGLKLGAIDPIPQSPNYLVIEGMPA